MSADKKVMVTGATGFIGRYLVRELLDAGAAVLAFSRRDVDGSMFHRDVAVIRGDLNGRFELPPGVSVIYHCAGVISRPGTMEAVNVGGTRRVVEAAKRANCRLIHLSSAGVVGNVGQTSIDESAGCVPGTLYERTKLQAEDLVRDAVASGLSARMLRPTIVFGSGRDPAADSFLHLARAIRSGRYAHVRRGRGIFNIVHAREVARAMLALDDDRVPDGCVYFINAAVTFRAFSSWVRSWAGSSGELPDIPYPIAYAAAAALTLAGKITGAKPPLTLSRLEALCETREFSQERLIAMTRYRPLLDPEGYVRRTCNEYRELGLI